MNGYERRTERKKELILKKAREMFFSNGVDNTSVEDIAKQAKVSKVTIFNYFGSKENLLRTVIDNFLDIYLEAGEKILNQDGPFEKKLETLFSLGAKESSILDTDIFRSEIWKEPALQHIYSESVAKAMPFMIRFFEQGKKEGVIDPSIPNEALLAFVSAVAALANPENRTVSKEYMLGISKLCYYGLLGDKTEYDKNILWNK